MHEISIDASISKEEKYRQLHLQILSLIEGETNATANICNTIAALHHTMNFFWTGLYFVSKNELALGMFQGTVACTKIGFGKGVCGACWSKKETIIVEDVEKFEGHIACSSLSQSEIVIPVFDNENKVIAVFDVDSEHLAYFDKIDKTYLEQILELVNPFIIQYAKANY